jgi:hypothetical protein
VKATPTTIQPITIPTLPMYRDYEADGPFITVMRPRCAP